jgi:hypothetical protein
MLEKMGWKPGCGLGAKEQGITEHIKVAYKSDKKCKCVRWSLYMCFCPCECISFLVIVEVVSFVGTLMTLFELQRLFSIE